MVFSHVLFAPFLWHGRQRTLSANFGKFHFSPLNFALVDKWYEQATKQASKQAGKQVSRYK